MAAFFVFISIVSNFAKKTRSLIRYILFFLVTAATHAFSQEVLWANRVLEKSSETVDEKFSPKYRAIQILGAPSVLPQTISSACSWRPQGISYGEDYIKVGFERGIKVRQIIVGETLGPGAIGRIFGYTAAGKELLLFQNSGDNTRKKPGIWNEFIQKTDDDIVAIKLLIVHSLKQGVKEYDCVGISSSDEPFVAKVNVAKDLPDNLEKINLGPAINSRYSEVAPLVSPDGQFLYFTRLNHPKNYMAAMLSKLPENVDNASLDVWVSSLSQDGSWLPAKNMIEPIHDGPKNAAATVAMDGKSIFALNVEVGKGRFDAGLTKVSLKNNKWTNKQPLRISEFEALSYYNDKDKKPKRETEFSMSSDEKYLVMGLVRKETFGDKDLYVSFKTGENSYSKPINLGPTINTAGNEGTPFLAVDNKTLYFNSNGHPGYGDMDIFMTTRLDDSWTKWTEPVNLGPLINSPQFDGYISIPASGEFAYFSSAKNSLGLDDLFKVKLFPSVKPEATVLFALKFVDSSTSSEIVPEVEIKNLDRPNDQNLKVKFVFDEETKVYKTILPIGYRYAVNARLKDYENLIEEVDYREIKEYVEVKSVYPMISTKKPPEKEELKGKMEVPIEEKAKPQETKQIATSLDNVKLEQGKKLILQEVHFDQSKSDLREESFPILEKIKKIMLENPSMEILLEGHTDNQGDANLNFKLAEDRIKNVKSYLTKDGRIDPNRINVKSWGQYRPIVKNSTEVLREKNRRVEFTILKM